MNQKETLKELIQMLNAKINHIEDMTADNRALIVKMIKQGNTIVEFLKGCELEAEIDMEAELPLQSASKIKNVQELIDEFMDRRKDLQELEEELQKNKDNITPGQVGEA
tara:strand:- start:486 stop:812 length:327 start_codon:yes stop_codon:yes gene_type:complete